MFAYADGYTSNLRFAAAFPFGQSLAIYLFLAVCAALVKFDFVGAPLAPFFLIFSPEPALILAFLAAMFAYKPGRAIIS
jgi:hypothetical protein